MFPLCSLFYVLIFIINNVYSKDTVPRMEVQNYRAPPDDIEVLIQKYVELARTSEDKVDLERAPSEELENIYEAMIVMLDKIIEEVKDYNKTIKFLNAKGIHRVVLKYFEADDEDIRGRLLILLKILFDNAPSETAAVIPFTVLDELIEIFEVENVAMKAHVLDILYVWMPNNPKVQERFMKLRALNSFYSQINKLDMNVVKTLLDLFNKIVQEHIKMRSEGQQSDDNLMVQPYIRSGLLEHMATSSNCNGLLNIFLNAWSLNSDQNNILMTVFELLKTMKSYCMNSYRDQYRAVKLFRSLQEYVKNPLNKGIFDTHGLNTTDIASVIEEYLDTIIMKEEF